MVKKGAIMERSSFDPAIVEKDEEERAAVEKIENSDGGVPQAKVEQKEPMGDGAKPIASLPVSAPQAGKSVPTKQGASGPILRSGPNRAVALRAEPVDPVQIIQAERERAEVGVAPPVAGK